HKGAASRSAPVPDPDPAPAEVDAGGRRQVGAAGDVHPLVRGQGAADLDLAVDLALVGVVDAEPDRTVGEVDELVLLQFGDPRPGDRDRLAIALDLARGQG